MATKKAATKKAKSAKAKGQPARKKDVPITSTIVLAVKTALGRKPKNPARAAAIAVIFQLARENKENYETPVIVALTDAYQQVLVGGGSDGGSKPEAFPPDEPGM